MRCNAKQRYATKAFADQVVQDFARRAQRYQPKAGDTLRAYYCPDHGCWHTGHSRDAQRAAPSNARQETIGRLTHLRRDLVERYGQLKEPDDWAGVRVLTRAIHHLQADQ